MIEQIGKLVSGVAKDIFSKAPEKVDIYKVGTNFINKNTNKRLIVTGTFGGVVEFVEIDLSKDKNENFTFNAISYTEVEKNKTPMENFRETLETLGYEL